ncbi:MAG: leucyl aminopeptidase [Methylotenera sp.]|nr:leucyl aminopeptidase [Oligoflexia bacterium]
MWKLPSLETRTAAAGLSSPPDTDLLVIYQDAGKKIIAPQGHYAPLVERFKKGEAFSARSGSIQYVRFGAVGKAENVMLVGFGQASELTEEKARLAGAHAWAKLSFEKARSVSIDVDSMLEARGLKAENAPAGLVRVIRAFTEGLLMSAYKVDKKTQAPVLSKAGKGKVSTKSKSPAHDYFGPERLIFVTQDKDVKKELDHELTQVTSMAEAINVARDWSNEPSNIGTPEFYAAEAVRLAREHGIKCTILDEKAAAREKMGLFLGVGAGSEREGRIVVLDYTPKSAKGAPLSKTIALVGKGVTFDSGGISIKPSMRMEDMKHDMTGASTIMGAILLAAKWKVPNRVVAILAFTENMPDGLAIQPGNVLVSRAGKTVEIINTDAEGRLVLADVLDYAHGFSPDAIIDAATLTGAVTVALGKHCCAVLGNDESLIQNLQRAGEMNFERIWELPLFDEYFDDLKSDYADMKNSANDGYGGTIRGAIFLKQFIKPGVAWAHLDIAGTAYGMGHLAYYPKKGASGAYVRTLAQFAADF